MLFLLLCFLIGSHIHTAETSNNTKDKVMLAVPSSGCFVYSQFGMYVFCICHSVFLILWSSYRTHYLPLQIGCYNGDAVFAVLCELSVSKNNSG